MFDLILSPLNAIRSWVAHKTLEAARAGAHDGLTRFAAELHQQFAELPAPADTPPQALPMPSAAQITAEDAPPPAEDAPSPAQDVPLYERWKELVAGGLSKRAAARQLDIPDSTARSWEKKEQDP